MKNILITGLPRTGKTTLVLDIIKEMKKEVIGFVTKEIRVNNTREGFSIETFSGLNKILASKKYKASKYRVASYGVYIENVDLVVEELTARSMKQKHDFIIIDEIGKMELFSLNFKKFVLKNLDKKKVLGTIMLRDNEFTRNIKNREDTLVFNLTKENRESVKKEIMGLIKQYA
ncbi:MAG: nucleoside-triphosphatase [Candidatus Thorarchaeota archaeon]